MKTIRIENKTQALPAPLQAIYCDSFLCRLRGLMGRSSLAHEEGLLLVEGRDSRVDTSIHMLFVYTDLAVIWINSAQVVVDTVLARSWRLAYAPREPARYILEIHPDRLNEFKIGDHVEFQNV
ncbi:MAG TPA: DUF192 domain-containing protein [Anaerolineales bacterium]|nr:DUF192 domain-containing protein [Anaerolineales bacterium]